MTAENEEAAKWSLYLVRTFEGSLYTGVTTDVQRRLSEHENKDKKNKGAKALRGKGPLTLGFKIVVGNRSDALKLRYKENNILSVRFLFEHPLFHISNREIEQESGTPMRRIMSGS